MLQVKYSGHQGPHSWKSIKHFKGHIFITFFLNVSWTLIKGILKTAKRQRTPDFKDTLSLMRLLNRHRLRYGIGSEKASQQVAGEFNTSLEGQHAEGRNFQFSLIPKVFLTRNCFHPFLPNWIRLLIHDGRNILVLLTLRRFMYFFKFSNNCFYKINTHKHIQNKAKMQV